MVLLAVRRAGLRTLYFVTLVPVALALAFLLRRSAIRPSNVPSLEASHPVSGLIFDLTHAAPPLDSQLRNLGGKDSTPLAVFNVKQDLAYGLNFYLNPPLAYSKGA